MTLANLKALMSIHRKRCRKNIKVPLRLQKNFHIYIYKKSNQIVHNNSKTGGHISQWDNLKSFATDNSQYHNAILLSN